VRLVTVSDGGRTRAGRLEGDEVVLLAADDVGALLRTEDWQVQAAADGPRRPRAGLRLAPVVPRPSQIFCLGLNYAEHVAEMGHERPPYPTIFAKFPAALLGPEDDLVLPAVSDEVDWEVELAVVIGRRTHRVGEEAALGAVAGYTVANDVSMRDWQRRTSQFLQGKTFARSTPVGPALVTPEELPAGAPAGLRLRTLVDDEVVQESTTDHMIFGVAACIAYLSTFTTLEPGDLILTGTPSGVGAGRTPPIFLAPGQLLTTEIEGVGRMSNRCVAEGESA